MSYIEKPLLKLYKNQNNSFELQAIIDDYESCSFQRNNYEAGQFSIEINYNIPNSQLFQEGLFIQFGNDSRDFGIIKNVRDSVGPDGKGSQIRNITGYDVRYIFKQRIIKDLNFGDSWTYSGSGELCMRNLIKSQCGEDAEQKRRLPVINNIPEIGIGSDYTVSEAYSNLYDVLVTIATQSEVGWYIEFKNGNLILEFTSGVDRSKTVRFDTDFNSLSDGTYEDSSESFANTVYVGGKGSGINKDIYEGEIKIEDEVPSGLDRFECWDNSSTLDNENDYKNEAVSKLIEYGQTVSLSGTGLAKCPYVYKEEYDVGDIITVAFTGKTAISRIISLTEYWSNGEYDIEFEFGKPIQDLSRQLSILISKIQTYQATAESSKKSNIRYYSIPSELEMPKEDVILDVIGFVGNLGTGQTFNLWFDNENKTGSKTYHVYFKQLQGSGKLTLTTGVPGSSTLEFDPGTYVSIIYVDADGNVSKIIGEGGGGSALVPSMTQAQYDKLTEAEKNNGQIREITNAEGTPIPFAIMNDDLVTSSNVLSAQETVRKIDSKVSEFTNYSTEEVVIGKWIDGRNVYKKTFYSSTDSFSSSTHFELPYLDLLLDFSAISRIAAGDYKPSLVNKYNRGTDNAYVSTDSFRSGVAWTLTYIKTTD